MNEIEIYKSGNSEIGNCGFSLRTIAFGYPKSKMAELLKMDSGYNRVCT